MRGALKMNKTDLIKIAASVLSLVMVIALAGSFVPAAAAETATHVIYSQDFESFDVSASPDDIFSDERGNKPAGMTEFIGNGQNSGGNISTGKVGGSKSLKLMRIDGGEGCIRIGGLSTRTLGTGSKLYFSFSFRYAVLGNYGFTAILSGIDASPNLDNYGQETRNIFAVKTDMNTGKVIGTVFPKEMSETTLCGFYSSGGVGDKKLVYRTDIMKEIPPYPIFDNEKYLSLGYKYQLCDQHFSLITTNKILCEVEYQADGSSMNMFRQYYTNPKSFAFIRKENMKYIHSKKRNFIDCTHYVSSSLFSKNRRFLRESPKKIMTLMAIPSGMILNLYIKKKVKKMG